MKTLAIKITGKVQGVFFRKGARDKATSLGLTGKVRNEPDASVYVLATGEEAALEEFIQWCWQGPSRASVDKVQVTELPLTHYTEFLIER